MNNQSLNFSQEKIIRPFTFGQFKRIAKKLESIVRSCRDTVDYEVLTCEDQNTYNWSTVTVPCDQLERALKRRKSYSLAELSRSVWDRSFKISLEIKDHSIEEPFMICLTHDQNEGKRLFFYGQSLDLETYWGIMEGLYTEGCFHKLGNGYPKPSDFNYRFLRAINPL